MAGQNESAGAGLGVYSMDRMVGDEGPFPHATPSGPYFDPEFSRNISVISGGKAVLNCRVYNIGNRTVSGYYLELWCKPNSEIDILNSNAFY